MENAAKALLIAGGILLALMTLSLIVYMSTATTRMAEAQDEKKAAEELTAFNMEYEAYNKSVMYGTDIITVVNKAINYNETATEKIEIELTIVNDYKTTIETIKQYSNERKSEKTKIESSLSLNAGTYKIDKLKNFFSQSANDELGKPTSKGSYTETTNKYSALTTFKRSSFRCIPDSVEYNANGRIIKMCFEEVKDFSSF